MRCITKVVEHDSRSDVFRIIPIGDCHLGHIATDERLLQRTIDDIKESENTFWIGLGDIVDGIGRMDKRHREESLAKWCHGTNRVFKEQRDRAVEMFRPIGSKCIGYIKGNHEEYLEASGVDLYYSVLEGIIDNDDESQTVPTESLALGMSGFIMLKFRRDGEGKGGTQAIVIYAHHGAGGGNLMGALALRLERLPASYDADVYIIGHAHKKASQITRKVFIDRSGNIQEKDLWACSTGSFMRESVESTTIYPERSMMKPQSLGSVEIDLRPGAKFAMDRIKVTL